MREPIIFISLFLFSLFTILLIFRISNLRKKGLTRERFFTTVDRIIVGFSLILLIVSLLFDFNYLQYKAPIPYKDWETITLDDFRGLKMPKMTLYGKSDFAYITSNIEISEYNDSISIVTFFHPVRSFVFNRRVYNKFLLKHEMFHFHITEYCARLIRKTIIENEKRNIKDYDINEIKEYAYLKENELQYNYDEETMHGLLLGRQVKWQIKIDSLLQEMKAYSKTTIFLNNY